MSGNKLVMKLSGWKSSLLVTVVLLAVMGFKSWWLVSYPLHVDELISLRAVKGIAEHGIPLFDNGTLYWRSLVSHYLLSIPYWFGVEDISPGRAVSLFFNVLTAIWIYRIARTLEDEPSPALTAALVFLFSAAINLNSYLLRDYATFNFFTLATAYYGYRYLICNEERYSLVLLALAPLLASSNGLAVGLLPVLAAGLVYKAVAYRESFFPNWQKPAVLFLLYLSCFALSFGYVPDNVAPSNVGVEMKIGGMADKWFFLKELRDYAPFALLFTLPGLCYGVCRRQRAYLYWGGLIVWLAVFFSIVSPMENNRYFLHVFSATLVYAVCSIWRIGLLIVPQDWSRRRLLVTLLLLLAIGGSLPLSHAGSDRVFGFTYKYQDAAPVHDFITRNLPGNALLISMQPALAGYYLHRSPDFFLREKVVEPGKRWSPFSKEDKRAFEIEVIDDPGKLVSICTENQERPVWIVADALFDYSLSYRMRQFIYGNFDVIYKDDNFFAVFAAKSR